jgi:hypothetical protein
MRLENGEGVSMETCFGSPGRWASSTRWLQGSIPMRPIRVCSGRKRLFRSVCARVRPQPRPGARPEDPGMPGSAADHRYLLDNAQAEAGERFDRLGVGPGWRCWEVGGGGRSVPEALAAAVGPAGYVLATDIRMGPMRDGGMMREAGERGAAVAA